MPSLSPTQLVDTIITALDESEASSVLISSPRGNPRRFVIKSGHNSFELWVYIWTLTHGGGPKRPPNEYRIQITSIPTPLELNPVGPTVLIGYEPNIKCFAGFDLSKHRSFSKRSPSIQIPITILNQALQNGFSFTTKGNDEIAVGIRPDQFLAYCLNAELLHREGADIDMIGLLSKAASLEEIPQDIINQLINQITNSNKFLMLFNYCFPLNKILNFCSISNIYIR